jgi:peptide/nickel transport system ATP-binding protein/oligopeptide transport system ATP-binding protein
VSLLELSGVEVRFRVRRGELVAVDGVDLSVRPGEVVALVGESGSGKTTLGRCVLGLQRPTAGRVVLEGEPVDPRSAPALVQPIFQDPYSSLDPRWPVGRSIREPLDAQGIGTPAEREARVAELLEQVGLEAGMARRRPRELSGGQRQRVAIAAALAPRPRLIVADEAVSALDMLVQAQILNLLADLRAQLGVSLLFITHDLAVVRHIADRVAVMYLGRIVEEGETEQVFADPRHPYTRTLLEAHPEPDPTRRGRLQRVAGEIPNPIDPPPGCTFHPRCPLAEEVCTTVRPAATAFSPAHQAACHVAARAIHQEEAACPPRP